MKIDNVLLEMESETQNAQTIKELVLSRLYQDDVITDEQFDKYASEMQIIVVKAGWFKRWFDKFRKNDKDGYIYKYVNFEN